MKGFLNGLDKFATWLGRGDPFLGLARLAIVIFALIVVALIGLLL